MKRIVILGAGESGAGAAILAAKQGFDVFVSDFGEIKHQYKLLLDKHHIRWEEKQHTESLILNADEVIKSPGIPDKAPMVKALREKKIPVISEIEFAGRYTKAKMICITGSNGKTTTTMLIYHILKEAGLNVGLAGNVGDSLALQVAEKNFDYYVVELSSFQLDGMTEFKADIAILMNITAWTIPVFLMQTMTDCIGSWSIWKQPTQSSSCPIARLTESAERFWTALRNIPISTPSIVCRMPFLWKNCKPLMSGYARNFRMRPTFVNSKLTDSLFP